MKNITYLLLINAVIFLLFVNNALSHEIEKIRPVEDVINDIVTKQKVSSVREIVCNKTSDSAFEEVGESVMERMAGSHELHEKMDAMMGVDSESLRQMHIAMGENWLNCGGSMTNNPMSSIMMNMMMRMTGNYYPAYFISYNTILTLATAGWILFIAMIIILVMVFTGKIKIKKNKKYSKI